MRPRHHAPLSRRSARCPGLGQAADVDAGVAQKSVRGEDSAGDQVAGRHKLREGGAEGGRH